MRDTIWVLISIRGINDFEVEKVEKVWKSKPTFSDLLLSRFSFTQVDTLLIGKMVIGLTRWYLKEINEGENVYDR